MNSSNETGVYSRAGQALAEPSPEAKCAAVSQLWDAVRQQGLQRGTPVPVPPPGRPERPQTVDPAQVPRRRLGSSIGRAALVHAIAHIEFNAINLALDAACRFTAMPAQFTHDWLSVAADEARHFQMLSGRLAELDHGYGDFPAHGGLWDMAMKTAASCRERMALVPRVLEARGLDVTPGMMKRLRTAGDDRTVDILRVILEEEERHVDIGSRWFHFCCDADGLNPESEFLRLLRLHFRGSLRGPFNVPARLRAGFSESEMAAIEAL